MKTFNTDCSASNRNVTISVKAEPASTGQESGQLHFSTPTVSINSCNSINKRPISLDLKNTPKKRLVTPSPLVIGSPETQNVKSLTTPDLEKLLHLLPTPQPGIMFQAKSTDVTSEQEAFGKGFEEALHSLRNNSNKQIQTDNGNNVVGLNSTNTSNVGTGMSGGSFTYTNLGKITCFVFISNYFYLCFYFVEPFNSLPIKDEPQHSSASPPVSPIDMETQEKIKLERKRQRNRVAASKCRKRKLERISKLEEKVKILKGENTDLGSIVKNLKEHVAQLKQQVIEHIESGCSINGTTLLQGK